MPLRNIGFQSAYPVLQGYKKYARPRATTCTSRIRCSLAHHRHHRRLHAVDGPAEQGRARPRRRSSTATSAGTPALSWNRSDFYDLFGPTNRSRRGFAAKVGYDHALIYDEPRRLDFRSEVAYYDNLDALPGVAERARDRRALVTGEAGLYYTDVRRSRGAVDDEKGVVATWCSSGNHADRAGHAAAARRLRLRLAAALRTFVALAAQRRRASPAATRGDPLRELLLRRLRQQLRRQPHREALPRVLLVPGLRAERDPAAGFARHMLEGNLPPVVFESVGTPALLPHLAAAGGVRRRGCGPTRSGATSAALRQRRARRWTCASASCTGTT